MTILPESHDEFLGVQLKGITMFLLSDGVGEEDAIGKILMQKSEQKKMLETLLCAHSIFTLLFCSRI